MLQCGLQKLSLTKINSLVVGCYAVCVASRTTTNFHQFKKLNHMKIRNITDKGKKLCDFVTEKTMKGELTNNDLLQLIEVAGSFLNLKTISDYAKENNLSYNGAKNHRHTTEIFNTKFVIDNN